MRVGNVLDTLWMKFTNENFIRFLFVGLGNTISTYLLYLLLINYISYNLAYSISYVAGIILSYYLNACFVFKQKMSITTFMKFPLVYVAQYLMNIVFMNVFIEYCNINITIAPILVIILATPITFILSKLVFK